MTTNHLDEIREVIILLKNEHLQDVATKLQDVLDNTFSGTELIMAVKFHLEKVPKHKASSVTQKHIDHLITNINKLLS